MSAAAEDPGVRAVVLDDRGVILVGGGDRVGFLQGLISNDARLVNPERALHAWLMTPQGRFLHDMIIHDLGDRLALDVAAERRDDLFRRLKMYKLRAKVTLEDASGAWAVVAVMGKGAAVWSGLANGEGADGGGDGVAGAARAWHGGAIAIDPRDPGLGCRAVAPRDALGAALGDLAAASVGDYHRLRVTRRVPDAAMDLEPERSLALEWDMEALGALSWDKGCYVGQEVTARTKYRALAKRRLVVVALDDGPAPPAGAPITAGEAEVGELRGVVDGLGLALVRLDAPDGPWACAGRVVTPHDAAR